MLDVDYFFWENPPWGDGKQKYRLGLKPIAKDEWLNREIGPSLYKHKMQDFKSYHFMILGYKYWVTKNFLKYKK